MYRGRAAAITANSNGILYFCHQKCVFYSCGNNRITCLLLLIELMSLSLMVKEPSEQNWETGRQGAMPSIRMSPAHEFTPDAHTLFGQ